MHNVYVFEYFSIRFKEVDYRTQKAALNDDRFNLFEYVESKPDLELKDTIEIKNTMDVIDEKHIEDVEEIKKHHKSKLHEIFKHIDKILASDDKAIFVIFFSNHTSFMNSFIMGFAHAFKSFISFCEIYFSMRNRLGSTGLYNRFMIKFGTSDEVQFKDLFNKDSQAFINNLGELSDSVMDLLIVVSENNVLTGNYNKS